MFVLSCAAEVSECAVSRQSSAISSPLQELFRTATPKCQICIAVIMNGIQAEAPQLPRHADFCFVSLRNTMTMLRVMGNGTLAT